MNSIPQHPNPVIETDQSGRERGESVLSGGLTAAYWAGDVWEQRKAAATSQKQNATVNVCQAEILELLAAGLRDEHAG